jgi:hypothetical protein
MVTRRDVFIALTAVVLTAGGLAIADKGPVMGSKVFDCDDR